VETNNPAGYSLAIASDASPALRSSDDSFADVATTPGTAIYNWSVPSGQAAFGYSVDGTDVTDNFLDNGVTCGVTGGTDSSDKCWTSFSTSYSTVSLRWSATPVGGNQTKVWFRAETTASRALKSGNYQTAIDVLALAL
jgi:hypothetical protein